MTWMVSSSTLASVGLVVRTWVDTSRLWIRNGIYIFKRGFAILARNDMEENALFVQSEAEEDVPQFYCSSFELSAGSFSSETLPIALNRFLPVHL